VDQVSWSLPLIDRATSGCAWVCMLWLADSTRMQALVFSQVSLGTDGHALLRFCCVGLWLCAVLLLCIAAASQISCRRPFQCHWQSCRRQQEQC